MLVQISYERISTIYTNRIARHLTKKEIVMRIPENVAIVTICSEVAPKCP